MDKIIRRKDIGESIYYDSSMWRKVQTSIDELINTLQELRDQGATHIDFGATNSDEVVVQAYTEYEETDEEYIQRKAKAKEAEEILLAEKLKEEKRQYEILKQKFEGHNG